MFTEETCAAKRERHSRGIKPEQAPLLNHIPISSTEPRGLYQPCSYTKKANKDDLELGEDDLVLFRRQFVSTAKSANFRDSSTFEEFILIPTGSKSFGQGTESRAGLE